MIVRIGILIAAVAVTVPAYAQQAELMNFGEAADSIVLNVGPQLPMPAAAAVASPLADVLAENFSRMSGSQAVEFESEVSAYSQIDVPLWIRIGVPARGWTAPSAAMIPLEDGPCGGSLYSPRPDIGFSAEQRRAQLYPLISAVACEHGLPVGLFDALIAQESRYRHDALSSAGAIGLSQLMPGTARYLGVGNPWDVVQNLRGGAKYLREQLDEFGRVDLALAAYNAGPGRVRPTRRVPRIRETMNYVSTITAAWSGTSQRTVSLVDPGMASSLPNPFRRASVLTYTSSNTENPR